MKELREYLETDPEFAQELIDSFCNNLVELRDSLLKAIDKLDSKIFLDVHHKVKPTLSYIHNDKLQQQADNIKSTLLLYGIESVDARTKNSFCRLCSHVVAELNEQLQQYLKIEL